jgi:pimeloyl-ACP methyl ester carboxylesterase
MTDSPRRPSGLEPSSLVHPAGLALYEKPALDAPDGVLICVHGSLDKGRSFARVARRLANLDVIAYDRRGYQGSRAVAPAADLGVQVDDLLEVISLVEGRGPITVFGHSLGGLIALCATVAWPRSMDSLCVFEAPLGWLLAPRATPEPATTRPPGEQAEAFFRTMTSDASWDRLSDAERATRRADGPALVADLAMSRGTAPFSEHELAGIEIDVVVATGSLTQSTRYGEGARVLLDQVPSAREAIVEGAGHGAHLTHPDGLARVLEMTVQLGSLKSSAR